MVAVYPTDAVFDVNTFSLIGEITYTNTGPSTTAFNLATAANHRGEVLAIAEGLLQSTTSYSLSNGNFTVDFFNPPNAANLTLKTVSVPSLFTKLRSFPTVLLSEFSNTQVTTINGNNFIINGVQTAWAFNPAAFVGSTDELLVTISGVVQRPDSFTFPSVTLGSSGIDITPALDAPDTLDIRVFDTDPILQKDRCSSMIDRKPDKGFTKDRTFDFVKFESQAGYEKRRLLSRKSKRKWQVTYSNISGLEKAAIETFYAARFGQFETFNLDLIHVEEEVGTAAVVFDEPLKITLNQSVGTSILQQFYTITLSFREVFD